MIGTLWVLFIYVLLPCTLLIFIWWDIRLCSRLCRAARGSYSRAMVASAVLLTVNVLLMWAFFVSSLLAGHTGVPSREHLADIQGHWSSYVGLVSSVVATALASESEGGLARKLGVWSGCGLLLFWLFMLFMTGEQLEIFRIRRS